MQSSVKGLFKNPTNESESKSLNQLMEFKYSNLNNINIRKLTTKHIHMIYILIVIKA